MAYRTAYNRFQARHLGRRPCRLTSPKVELHVHLVGAMTPDVLLKLARRNRVALPATDPDRVREWYRFRDFAHFVEVYVIASTASAVSTTWKK
jgi:adenosine deaminase